MMFVVKNVGWVFHKINEAQLTAKVQMLNELLGIVPSAQHQRWEFMLTLGESWLYLSTDHSIIWLRESESLSEKEKHMIQAKKT
jgi:hypothetical protein